MLSDFEWTVLTLPARYFKWRTRGNALWWAFEERETLASGFDVVLAASTVDLSTLVGLVPELGEARLVCYFHENQFAYPRRDDDALPPGAPFDANLMIRDVYCAACADAVAFNSDHNRATFFEGLGAMESAMPDFWPRRLANELGDRSSIVPVGLDETWFEPRRKPPVGPLSIVWNHRWEFDKAPERFFRALELLAERDVDFVVHVLGERFRTAPEAFDRGRAALGERVVTWGFVEDGARYREILRSADVAVSTALHEFQGLAMLEAAASGCLPLAPRRLAYPELFEEELLYDGDLGNPETEARELADRLAELAGRLDELRAREPSDVSVLSWQALAPAYRALLTG